jgi:hyperosmotically inducible protein
MKGGVRRCFSLLPALLLLGLSACATPYGLYVDERPLEKIRDDASIRSNVVDALRAEGYAGAGGLTAHVYFGRVFLTGEMPEEQIAGVVRTAQAVKGVEDVTVHRFISVKTGVRADAALRLRLEKNLIGAAGVASSRIDYVVNSGRIVLLGVTANEEESRAAAVAARATRGARSVTSYLFVRRASDAPRPYSP